MIIAPGFIGIDVSKDNLDIFDGTARRIDNTAEAIAAWMADLAPPQRVLFEATGRYDWLLGQQLRQAGISFVRVNPMQARAFARATGRLAKTDAIDARLLAAMAQALDLAPDPSPQPERQDLADLHRRRAQLVGIRQQERTRLATAAPAIAGDIGAHVAWLDERIAELEVRIAAQIAAFPELDIEARLLRTIPGIGPVAATTLLALMPELGRRNGKAIAALAGLAPMNRDSGRLRGQRTIAGGRPEVRRALYMAAVSTIRSRSRFADLFAGLTARGKPAKLALIAIARKLIVTANAIIANRQPFTP